MTPLLTLTVIAVALYLLNRGEGAPPPPTDRLDQVLFWLSKLDPFTYRDLVRSILIMGSPGSGKTSSVGKILLRAVIRHAGVLLIASKPEDREMVEGLCREAGKELFVVEPGGLSFNLFKYEANKGADARQLTEMVMTVSEVLTRADGGTSDKFFGLSDFRWVHTAIDVILLAHGVVDTWSIYNFILDAALSKEQLDDPEWRGGYHYETISAAFKKEKTATEARDFARAEKSWLYEWPLMSERTRSSILAGIVNKLHVFNSGIVSDLIGSETGITPEALDQGAVILVDMPIPQHGVSGGVVAGAWKYAVQRHILRRADWSTVICLWSDEYQNHITSFDAKFLAECRSHGGCMCVLTQSIHSIYSSIGGKESQSHTKALLSCFASKIFMALGDEESAKYASSLVGKDIVRMAGASRGGGAMLYDELTGRQGLGTSLSERIEDLIQARYFQNGLKTGGPENGYIAQGWIVRNGQPFSTGENAMLVDFSQR
jgi:hypothetical protein